MTSQDTYKSESCKTALQFTGNQLYLTATVFRLDSCEWHAVDEVEDLDYEITDYEIEYLVEYFDSENYDVFDSLFSMSEGML